MTQNLNQKQHIGNDTYITFAAIKLIEGLFKAGKIDEQVFKSILKDNERKIDITQFSLAS